MLMQSKSTDRKDLLDMPGLHQNDHSLSPQDEKVVIFMLIVNEEIRNHMLRLCRQNNYDYYVATNPEKLVNAVKALDSAISFVDFEAVNTCGSRIYSRLKVACADCNVILLSDTKHKNLIKEAMEMGAYACILAPYAEWEVLTMIRNLLAKKKLRG